MSDELKKILIVGGGTAGWMTAVFLAKRLDTDRYSVTLVESPEVATVGVGEATIPPLVAFVRAMEIDELELMTRCHATFKLGIKFVDWHRGDDAFWHPFGYIGGLIDDVPVFHHWLRARREGRDDAPYSFYSLQALLADQMKAPRSLQDGTIVTQHGTYAYHLDAAELAGFLKDLATRNGVQHLLDDVDDVTLDERGFVQTVETRRNGALSADLFVDCSGFRSLLIEGALEDPHIDWSDRLLCDRAVVLHRPVDGPLPPYTTATALDAGWAWDIPMSHRTSHGYVHSSQFTSPEEAAQRLLAHAGQDPDGCELRSLAMRVGRRGHFWVKNCVSIGLAAGFIEPLESTGIFLAQKGAELLLDYFPDRSFNPALVRRYNAEMGTLYEEVRDFVLLHYFLSEREDSAFWKANRNLALPDSLRETLELYDETGHVGWEHPNSLFKDTSFQAVAAGLCRLPRRHLPQTDFSDADAAWEILGKIREQSVRLADTLPDHTELIEAMRAGTPTA